MDFKYTLYSRVKLKESSEQGEVTARAEYTYCDNQYLIRYMAGDGRMVESWWTETAISQV